MSEPALFDVDPWREATAADVRVGDWIKGFSWPWSWKCVIRIRQTNAGHVSIDTADTHRGSMTGGHMERPDRPVLIFNGTPEAVAA